jgi:hypothetical protein
MNVVMLLLLIISLCAFGFGAFCQVKAKQHISREKLESLDVVSPVPGSTLPPKEILSDKGAQISPRIRYRGSRFRCLYFYRPDIIIDDVTAWGLTPYHILNCK